MRRILLVLSLILLPMIIQAQKIEKDYYDQFTGKRVMFTKLEKVNWKYKNDRIGGKMQMRFVLNDKFQYLVLHWYSNNYLEVADNAKIQFKLDNGFTIGLQNEIYTGATKGGTGISKNDVGVSLNCVGSDITKFSNAIIVAIRIHTSEGFYDFEIDRKDGEAIHKAYMLFSREVYVGGYN